MLRATSRVRHLDVDIWTDSSAPEKPTEDDYVFRILEDSLRVAVIDGCTAGIKAPMFGVVNAPTHATSILRSSLVGQANQKSAFRSANDRLLSESQACSVRSRPQAACVSADIDLRHNTIQFTATGDCELWIRLGNSWTQIFGGTWVSENLSEALAEIWSSTECLNDALRLEEECWSQADERDFVRPLVGTLPSLTPVLDNINQWDELVLSTDGARLTEERLHQLESWLEHLRSWESRCSDTDVRKAKPSDDVTVLRISPTSP